MQDFTALDRQRRRKNTMSSSSHYYPFVRLIHIHTYTATALTEARTNKRIYDANMTYPPNFLWWHRCTQTAFGPKTTWRPRVARRKKGNRASLGSSPAPGYRARLRSPRESPSGSWSDPTCWISRICASKTWLNPHFNWVALWTKPTNRSSSSSWS